MWRNFLLAVFGAWFVVSPWAMGITGMTFEYSAVIIGGLLLIAAVWAMADHRKMAWRAYLMGLFGLYLGLNPFFFGFSNLTGALWLMMLTGAATVALGIWAALAHVEPSHPEHHGEFPSSSHRSA